jgi:DNA-binding transcriptional MerR regulator
MHLTPGQVREVLGLSQDTFRHWKTALPPLAGRNGYRPCFSHGDLFAMALIHALTEDAGIRIGALQAVSASLFEQCNRQAWAGFERSVLVLELARVRVEFAAESHIPQLDRIGIIVPCRSIIADLRERLLKDAAEAEQGNLKFAPTMVRGGAA